MSVSKYQPLPFHFHASGYAFSGHFYRPADIPISAQAALALPIEGGIAHSRLEKFEIPGLVSLRMAQTHLSGSWQDENTATTSATVVVEGLRILDFLSVERVVTRMTSEYKVNKEKNKESHIIALGSQFDGLRLGGFEVKVTLRHSLLVNSMTFADLQNNLKNDAKSGKLWVSGDEAVLCSLVEKIETDLDKIPGVEIQGHVIRMPHYGEIALAEVFASYGSRTLTMLQFNLGSPDEGRGSSGSCSINGLPVPGAMRFAAPAPPPATGLPPSAPGPAVVERLPSKSPPRYTNVCITKTKARLVLPFTHSLRARGNYALRLNIGPWTSESVVRNAKPFRGDLLPASEEGHWLEVIVASDDFRIEKHLHHIFLPRIGASYACPCTPGGAHTCTASDRLPYLFVPFRAPALSESSGKGLHSSPLRPLAALRSRDDRKARLRIAIYYQKNLVESQLLTASVKVIEGRGRGAGYGSWIDYSLTLQLTDVSFLPPRTVNILTNDNFDDSHKLIINSDLKDPISFNLNAAAAGSAITAARQALRNVGIKEYGGTLGAKIQYESLYDKNNAKSKQDFIVDLRHLALLGWKLWVTLFQSQPEARTALSMHLKRSLARPTTIQVSRVEGSTMMFPWSLVYDIPLETDINKHTLCRSLETWDTTGKAVPDACPFEAQHRKNIICPFGFWGINHVIEQPPSMPKARSLPILIKKAATHAKPQLVMGISLDLDPNLTQAHKTKLEQKLTAIQVLSKNSRDEIEKALGQEELELVYFYCHGRRESLAGTNATTPYIEVGKKEGIAPNDITAWQMGDSWSETHWKETSPLVFINGCHTAEITPELLVNFVDSFVGVYAAGVIGTEILLLQEVASEAAEQLLAAMNNKDQSGQHTAVGQAMRRMRLYFLGKGNLLGLAYTPYCSADLKLAV